MAKAQRGHGGFFFLLLLLFSFYRKGFSNILSFHKILQKCETWSHNYFAICSTAPKSSGISGVHLNLLNNEKGILKAVFALLKCIGPFRVDDDVVFLNGKKFWIIC